MNNAFLLSGGSGTLIGQRCEKHDHDHHDHDHTIIQRTISRWKELRKTWIGAVTYLMGRLVEVAVLKNGDGFRSSKQRTNNKIDCIQKTVLLHQIILKQVKNLRRTFTIIVYSFMILFVSIFFTGAVRSIQQCHASLPSSPSSTVQTTTTLVPSMVSMSTDTDTAISESDHTVLVATVETSTAIAEPVGLVESEQDTDERNENVSSMSPVEEEEQRSEGKGTRTELGEQCDSADDGAKMGVAATEETTSTNDEVETGNSPTVEAKVHDKGENFIAPAVAAVVGSGTVFLLRKQNNIPRDQTDYDETTQEAVQDEKKVTIPATAATSQKTELLPLMAKKYIDARSQPKSVTEESKLADKYASIPDVGDRAFQILLDLGMIESSSS